MRGDDLAEPAPDGAGRTAPAAKRIVLLGATGTIGRACARALRARGHDVTAIIRPGADRRGLDGVTLRPGEAADPASLSRDGLRGERFDAVVSCLASRTGAPGDAWAIDHDAHVACLDSMQTLGIPHMILLSAICVQRPRLAFQHAKRAFEDALIASPVSHSIIRPTAYFKSLSGQVARVRAGKPYIMFADGRLTACKPIDDDDLAAYLARAVTDPGMRDQILPIGGPGPALTPREMGEMLFELTGRPARFRRVPTGLLGAVEAGLTAAGRLSPRMAARAEFARIARYYATESMLALDPETGRPDAAATPACGTRTLRAHYAAMLRGEVGDDRGDHAVF